VHFADRLIEQIVNKGGPICVGLDPVFERLPASLQTDQASLGQCIQGLEAFSKGVIDAVADEVPCVKIQSACYERYGAAGVELYHRVSAHATDQGLIVIGDAKRGDIGISAAHYAVACLDENENLTATSKPRPGPDALTINAYFGSDGIEPFIDVAREKNKGLFALVRTSNPGGDAIQNQMLADGRTVAQMVGALMAQLGDGEGCIGQSGYSLLGAVVGATKPEDAKTLRQLMPKQIFLVPGFGAQGGKADDVRACFNDDGLGAVITSSRAIIYAFAKENTADWQSAIRDAAVDMKKQIVQAIGN
jgi:orotidine-5'-phosphate decarboxylase